MAGSCRMGGTCGMHTGLSQILNHNARTYPILGAYMYK